MSFNGLMYPITLQRNSTDLVSETLLSTSIAVDYQPSEPSLLSTQVSGCSVFGQCLISGTNADSVSINELLSFTQDDTQLSSLTFNTIVGITTSNFVGGNIQIQGVLASGEPLNVLRTIRAVYGRIYSPDSDFALKVAGYETEAIYKFMCRKLESDLIKGDFLTEGGETYELIVPLHAVKGAKSTHHYESLVKYIES